MAPDHDLPGVGRSTIARIPGHYGRLRRMDPLVVLAGLAALALVAALLRRLLVNSPLDLPGLVTHGPAIDGAAVGVSAVAALVVGLVAVDRRVLVGLVAVGVFGLFATVVPAARLPAAGAVVAGGLLAVTPTFESSDRWVALRKSLVAGIILAGATLSLGAAMSVVPPVARSLGSLAFLLGLGATPLVGDPDRVAWAVGGLAAALTMVLAAFFPFVSGAALLVGWAAVGTPALVVAGGFGGITAATVGAVRRGHRLSAFGALALFAAGVPSSTGRAVAVVFGLTLLLWTEPITTAPTPQTSITGGIIR